MSAEANTHYGVIVFDGDLDCVHPDPELCGQSPNVYLIACGPENYCWRGLDEWIEENPLRMWERAEVLVRDVLVVNEEQFAAQCRRQDA